MTDKEQQMSVAKMRLEIGRRRTRRQWAKLSFYFLLSTAVLSTSSLLFHPGRLDIAAALSGASPFLNGILAVFVAIVMWYMGISAAEGIARNRYEMQTRNGELNL